MVEAQFFWGMLQYNRLGSGKIAARDSAGPSADSTRCGGSMVELF